MTAIDLEIERCKAAVVRHQDRLDAMSAEWRRRDGSCCPGCMFGAEHTRTAEKAERAEAWLCILLGKRGGPDDASLADSIRMGAWP